MRKTIITTVLIALLALMGTVGSASAASSNASLIVSPGSRVCTNALFAGYQVRAQGSAASPVRWTLNRSADGVNYTQLSQVDSTGYFAQFNSSFVPSYFPGWFKLCARNIGTQGVNVNMTLLTDGSFY